MISAQRFAAHIHNGVVLLCCLLLWQPCQADTAFIDQKAGFRFPSSIADFKYVDKTIYDKPLGYSLVYRNSHRTTISLIVYDNGIKDIQTGINGKHVRAQFAQASGDIHAAVAQGYYLAAETLPQQNHFSANFLSAGFLITNRNKLKTRSHLLITGFHRHFIKIRATGFNDVFMDDSVAEFVKKLEEIIGIMQTTI